MRRARVYRQGIPQLCAALEAGEITLYRAGEISKMTPAAQAKSLGQWRARSVMRTHGQAIAAAAIRKALTRDSQKIDLDRVTSAIKRAIIAHR
jgi:hypothetical protein